MVRSVILFAFALAVEGVQVHLQPGGKPFIGKPDTRKKCSGYCKTVGCPKGFGCCTNSKKMVVVNKYKNPNFDKSDACFKRNGIWCSQGGWTWENRRATCIPIEKPKPKPPQPKPPPQPTTVAPQPDPYDCRTREQWSEEKAEWCCENKNLGCEATTVAPTTVDVSAQDDPHLVDTSGDKFDLYQAGRQTMLVIPRGASKASADLHIRATVEKYGERENDLWIRSLAVSGKWVPGGSFQFKTTDGTFNSDSTLLVRHSRSDSWSTLNAFGDSNLLSTSADEASPSADFAESIARKVSMQAGPVKVLVNYGTARKSGEDVNHLDLHVEGLESVDDVDDVGGLLSGEVLALLNTP